VSDGDTGLRERSKARRRAHIQRTALSMFARKGYDHTTVVEIAEAADVAPRTVSGYFPSKLDLATSFADEIAGRLIETFTAYPDADLATVVDHWLAGLAADVDPELIGLVHAMYDANPGLRALGSARVGEAALLAEAALGRELGLGPDDPIVPLCRAALGAILAGAINRLPGHGDPGPERRAAVAFVRGVLDAARAAVPD
jgi:AcrR family transcriptional regulator